MNSVIRYKIYMRQQIIQVTKSSKPVCVWIAPSRVWNV